MYLLLLVNSLVLSQVHRAHSTARQALRAAQTTRELTSSNRYMFHWCRRSIIDYQYITKSALQEIVAHFYFNILSINKLGLSYTMKLYFLH